MRKAVLPLFISFSLLPLTSFAQNGRVWDDTAYYNNVEPTTIQTTVSAQAQYGQSESTQTQNTVYQNSPPTNVQRVSDPSLYETNPAPETVLQTPEPLTTSPDWSSSYAPSGYALSGAWADQALSQARGVGAWAETQVLNTSSELDSKIDQAAADGKPYLIWVNIPSYTLRVYDTSSRALLLTSKVIVGATGSQTPIFETNVVNLKYNPDWSPPASLQRKGKRYVPPGPNNPLGQVRFSTDNNRSIYLHDTNHHELFDRSMRALSAGCVRVSRWNELAQILSGEDQEAVTNHTVGNTIKFVKVPPSLVWISYQRLDLDESGQLVVFPDIYRKQTLPNQ